MSSYSISSLTVHLVKQREVSDQNLANSHNYSFQLEDNTLEMQGTSLHLYFHHPIQENNQSL